MNARALVDKLLSEEEVQPTPAQPAAQTPSKHPSYYDRKRAISILPIGLVNLTTGKNALFGNVFDGWEEGSGVNLLVKDQSTGKFMAVHSSGDVGIPVGTQVQFKHDQSFRPIGEVWEVIGIFPHSKEGLTQLSQKAGKAAVSMATFK